MSRPAWPGTLVSGRHAGPYTDAARQADNAARALFMRRTPAERERTPDLCIPSGSGAHRQISYGEAALANRLHGLASARRYRGL